MSELKAAIEDKPSKREHPTARQLDAHNVLIGNSVAAHIVPRASYFEAFHRAKSSQNFVLRLLGVVYSPQELARSSFYGGTNTYRGTRTTKEPLYTKIAFRAILVQAQIDFPGFYQTEKSQTDLRDAVNAKCRRAFFGLKK